MKTTTEKLRTKVAAMSREDLEELARAVVWSLYASTYTDDEKGMDDELDALGLEDGGVYLDSDKEWSPDTIEEVRRDLDSAGLLPEDL